MHRWLAVLLLPVIVFAEDLPEPISGYDFLGPEMRQIQDDEFLNPGMEAVEAGHELFNWPGDEERACADCHGANGDKLDLKAIAAYPRFETRYNRLMTLQERINACWTDNLDRFSLVYDDEKLLLLETFVRNKAKGEVIQVLNDERARDMYQLGALIYKERFGQMGMTCHQCHVVYQGRYLRGSKLTQGQTNGFPVYRFKSDRLTSLHRRYNECFVQLRSVPYEVGGEEYRALEYYMAIMSNGLKIETPGVRH